LSEVLALWGVPRSLSTAFERMVRERGDHDVAFEPFAAHYYFSAQRRSSRFDGEVTPAPEHGLEEILADLRDRRRGGPVFVKDMAYHVAHRADAAFLRSFTNTFILRHPAFALPSLARIWPDFTFEESGFAAVRTLFDRVRELTGRVPPVIDGEQLKTEPERVVRVWCEAVGLIFDRDALTWEPGRAEGWGTWSPWVSTVERSSGLPVDDPPSPRDPAAVQFDDPRLRRAVEACLDDYEHVITHRLCPP
jgi:hypothetical protein